MTADVSFPVAFLAGVLSFLSPCILPLVPSYLSFITGLSFESLTASSTQYRARVKKLTIVNSLIFILGFSTIFISLGAASSYAGRLFIVYQDKIRIVGGILIIIFGLFISGVIRPGFLMRERKFHLQGRPTGYFGAFVIGMTFAAGWTPCIGPILGSILAYTATKGSAMYGFELLSVYSVGLAVPFLISALAINSFLLYSRRIFKYMRIVMFASGLLMVLFGVLLLMDKVKFLSGLFPDIGINF
jgi:cytochrome c-type biogenesis protein